MKIIVIKDFWDKAFDNKILRTEGDIIDTDDIKFNCSIELAKERIKNGFCVEMEELPIEEPTNLGSKAPKKGKKASKKK